MVKTKFFSFIFATAPDQLPDRKQKALFYTWNVAALLLSSAGICVLSLFLAIGPYLIVIFFDYFRHPLILLLNWLPVLMLQVFFWCLFVRQGPAFFLTALLVLAGSIANYYKLRFRYEPVCFSDLSIAIEGLKVLPQFDMTPNARIIASIIYTILGTAVLLLLARGQIRSARLRLALPVLLLLSVFPLWHFVYSNDHIYDDLAVSNDHILPLWTQQLYISKGFIYPFIHSIGELANVPPDGYDEAVAAQQLAAYESADIPQDRRVNLLVIQMEAFCDLERIGIEGISPEAYAVYHGLEQEGLAGNLVVNVYGGTTIDTERCFLSGSYAMMEYSKNSYSHVRYLTSQGYTAIGNHPYFSGYFSRRGVNTALGLENYRFYDDYFYQIPEPEEGWYPDQLFLPEVLSQYLDYAGQGRPVFSFNVTTQSHATYDDMEYKYDTLYWSGEQASDYSRHVVNNYLGSVHDTQIYLSQVVDALRADSRPVVLLLYGDHKPWMGNNASVLRELEIDISPATQDGFLNYYSTRYLIWANDAAKKTLGDDLTGQGPDVSSGFLMDLLFEKLGWTGSDFMQFERDVREVLPVVTSNGYYYEDGRFTTQLSPAGEDMFRDLQAVTYYVNKSYPFPQAGEDS